MPPMTQAPLDEPLHPAIAEARRVLEVEAAAILGLVDHLDHHFIDAVELVAECTGRIVTMGVGKSGIICKKISATLASTGTPSFFMHPTEAIHGDLGMLVRGDVVLAISNSGETEELVRLLPSIKRVGAEIIAITGNPTSTLARGADHHLNASISRKHVRSASRQPLRLPRRWLSAMRWRWRSSCGAASAKKTSASSIPAESSASAFSACMS
jgi:D-arabinose 5-phosphate isomerase GutQ